MMEKQNPKVVIKEFAQMISELTDTRHKLLFEANRAWETYKLQLYQEYFIDPPTNSEMMIM